MWIQTRNSETQLQLTKLRQSSRGAAVEVAGGAHGRSGWGRRCKTLLGRTQHLSRCKQLHIVNSWSPCAFRQFRPLERLATGATFQ